MQVKSFIGNTIKLLQSAFGKRPETFNSIDMIIANRKNILRMIDSQMFRITNINQPVISFLSFIILLTLLFSSNCKLFESRQNLVNLENESPESVLGIYWNASFNGNTEILKSVTSTRPNDFFEDCKLKNNSVMINSERISETDKTNLERKNEKEFKTENDLTGMSSYISASKIKFTKVKVVEKKIFEDEAILTVLVADYSGNFERAEKLKFYFKKQNDVWKIVSYLDKGFFDMWGEPKYGTERPFCNKE